MASNALIACANNKLSEWLFSVLRTLGFANIVSVRNEQELLKVISEANFRLVLVDDDQHNFKSVRIISKLQRVLGHASSNFVVIMDGSNPDVIDAVKYRGLTLAGILLKPFEAHALQKIIAKLSKNITGSAPQKLALPQESKEQLFNAKLFTAKVIDCNVFVGVSFKGELSYGEAAMIKRVFYKAYSIDKSVMIAINISEVSAFDEGFAGLLLQYNGMVAERGRHIVVIVGKSKVARRFESLGLSSIMKRHSTTSDFYTEIGYFST